MEQKKGNWQKTGADADGCVRRTAQKKKRRRFSFLHSIMLFWLIGKLKVFPDKNKNDRSLFNWCKRASKTRFPLLDAYFDKSGKYGTHIRRNIVTKHRRLMFYLVPRCRVRKRFSACSLCFRASSSWESLCFSSIDLAWPALTKASGVWRGKKWV